MTAAAPPVRAALPPVGSAPCRRSAAPPPLLLPLRCPAVTFLGLPAAAAGAADTLGVGGRGGAVGTETPPPPRNPLPQAAYWPRQPGCPASAAASCCSQRRRRMQGCRCGCGPRVWGHLAAGTMLNRSRLVWLRPPAVVVWHGWKKRRVGLRCMWGGAGGKEVTEQAAQRAAQACRAPLAGADPSQPLTLSLVGSSRWNACPTPL